MRESKRVVVVGAGQMGRGIAQVAAGAGYRVQLTDASRELAERGVEIISKELSQAVERGRMTLEAQRTLLEHLAADEGNSTFERADIVIEAISEKFELKEKLFRDVDALNPEALLASNTSSIPITRLAGVTQRPDRVIGIHFFNPVPRMKLVEIIRALQTSDEAHQRALDFVRSLDKTIIQSKDAPGFLVNRILIPLINEACFALQEGIGSAQDIDQGAKLGLNHPMGPLELADFVGLDTVLAIAEVLQRDLGDDKYRPSPLLRQYVAAGWLGKKSGRGFYTYPKS